MRAEREEGQEDQYSGGINSIQEQFLFQQHQQLQQQQLSGSYGGEAEGRGNLSFCDISQTLPWHLPPVQSFQYPLQLSANQVREQDPLLVPPPPPASYAGLFNRRGSSLQFCYEGPSSNPLQITSETLGSAVQLQPRSSSFTLQAELGKMTAQEIMDAKALAASKSHSEAERRRRERINNHLAKLRSLLPNTAKTDKASLLAEVIQHVKELKRQTSVIAEECPVPSEIDELTVDASDEDGRFIVRASLCCEDRSDLLPDLIKTLKALRLRTLKAEITTLGGRVRNVLFFTGEDEPKNNEQQLQQEEQQQPQYSISSIHEALKAVMERAAGDESSSGSIKRQRTNVSTIEHS